jgi:hypothetical protein
MTSSPTYTPQDHQQLRSVVACFADTPLARFTGAVPKRILQQDGLRPVAAAVVRATLQARGADQPALQSDLADLGAEYVFTLLADNIAFFQLVAQHCVGYVVAEEVSLRHFIGADTLPIPRTQGPTVGRIAHESIDKRAGEVAPESPLTHWLFEHESAIALLALLLGEGAARLRAEASLSPCTHPKRAALSADAVAAAIAARKSWE